MDIHNEGNWHIETMAGASVESREFSARRGAQWQEVPVLALDESGVIQECSAACVELFGAPSGELVGQHISSLYPQLSGFKLFLDGRFNPMLQFLCHCGHLFQASNKQGGVFDSELNFASIEDGGRRGLRLFVRPLGSERSPGMSHVQII